MGIAAPIRAVLVIVRKTGRMDIGWTNLILIFLPLSCKVSEPRPREHSQLSNFAQKVRVHA